MSRVADALGIVKSVLESNHPDATVKSAESGECDFRVSSVGASISVTPYGDYEVTEKDVDDVYERAAEEIDGRHLEPDGTKGSDDESFWFDLKS